MSRHVRRTRRDNLGRGIYLLPNLFTTASMMLGLYAVVRAMRGDYGGAAVVIMLASVCDWLDGRVARLTNTISRFGVEYDSLSDLVSFGVAPAMMLYLWSLNQYGRLGMLASFLFTVCGALRLARFNIQADSLQKRRFTGLPIPMAAFLPAATVWLNETRDYINLSDTVVPILATFALAFLMVSNVKYQSFKTLSLRQKHPFRNLVLGVVVLIVIASRLQLSLFLLSVVYVFSGPVQALYGYLCRSGLAGEILKRRAMRAEEHDSARLEQEK